MHDKRSARTHLFTPFTFNSSFYEKTIAGCWQKKKTKIAAILHVKINACGRISLEFYKFDEVSWGTKLLINYPWDFLLEHRCSLENCQLKLPCIPQQLNRKTFFSCYYSCNNSSHLNNEHPMPKSPTKVPLLLFIWQNLYRKLEFVAELLLIYGIVKIVNLSKIKYPRTSCRGGKNKNSLNNVL